MQTLPDKLPPDIFKNAICKLLASMHKDDTPRSYKCICLLCYPQPKPISINHENGGIFKRFSLRVKMLRYILAMHLKDTHRNLEN